MKHNTLKSVFTIALMMFAGISFLSSSAFAQSSPWVTTTASPYTNPYATPSYPASSYTSDYIYYYNSLHSPAVNPNLIEALYIELLTHCSPPTGAILSSSAFAQSPPWVTTTASPYTNPYATPSYPANPYNSNQNLIQLLLETLTSSCSIRSYGSYSTGSYSSSSYYIPSYEPCCYGTDYVLISPDDFDPTLADPYDYYGYDSYGYYGFVPDCPNNCQYSDCSGCSDFVRIRYW